jgi:predicted nucleic acid-binding protein
VPPIHLLDTSVLVFLLRGGATAARIESDFGLRASPNKPLICGVTVGELWALAEVWNYGPAKREAIQAAIEECVVVPIEDPVVVAGYVSVYKALREAPKGSQTNVGENDIWIAAVAVASGATLLTGDAHFDVLHPHVIQRVRVENPRTKR